MTRVVRTTPARAILRREGHPIERRRWLASWLTYTVPAVVTTAALVASPVIAIALGVS